jgi:hypothetical protein
MDVAPGGTELEPHVNKGSLGRLLALVVNPVASVMEFTVCEWTKIQEGEDSGDKSKPEG